VTAEGWEKDTIRPRHPNNHTAREMFHGKVVIGNGGAEYGVRGYRHRQDDETGEQAWRAVRRCRATRSKPFEDSSMEAADTTLGPRRQTWWINARRAARPWIHHLRYDLKIMVLYRAPATARRGTVICAARGGDNLYIERSCAQPNRQNIWHTRNTRRQRYYT